MKLDAMKVVESRERLGLAQEELAKRAEVSPNTILRVEHGLDIRPVTARRIARGLGLEVDDLYPKVVAPTSPPPGREYEERRWKRAWADTFENALNVARGYLHGHVQEADSKPLPLEVALRVQHLYSNLGRVMETEGGWERLAHLEEAQDPDGLRLLQAAESLHDLGGLANRLAHASAEAEEKKLREEFAHTEEGFAPKARTRQ